MARKCIRRKRGASGKMVCAKFSGVASSSRRGKSNLGKSCVRFGRAKNGKKVCRKFA